MEFIATRLHVRELGLESSSKISYHLVDLIFIPLCQDIIAEYPQTHGSVFCPIILGSDKTIVSVGTGHTEYWPVYLSIGNIHNNIRQAHRDGVVLLGFLAIPKRKHHIALHDNF